MGRGEFVNPDQDPLVRPRASATTWLRHRRLANFRQRTSRYLGREPEQRPQSGFAIALREMGPCKAGRAYEAGLASAGRLERANGAFGCRLLLGASQTVLFLTSGLFVAVTSIENTATAAVPGGS